MLDCSNGIGGDRIEPFLPIIREFIDLSIFNTSDVQKLNTNTGAEYVHKEQLYPELYQDQIKDTPLEKIYSCSFDGDADRIVYYIPVEGFQNINLLDGDRYITLFAQFFKVILDKI